jgi:hypothetical protein
MLNQVRTLYFKILLNTFFPHLAAAEKNRVQPHAYWLTRQSLLTNFTPESSHEPLIH